MPPVPSRRLMWIAVIFYCPMLASAFLVRPRSLLAIGPDAAAYSAQGLGMVGAALASMAIVLGSRWAARATQLGRTLREELGSLLGGMTSRQILTMALLSAFAEEILFRGVAMAYLGVWGQGALFGLVHLPLRRALWPWTVFAIVMGFGLGWLTRWCGSLWPAVLVHFSVNHFNLHDLTGDLPQPPVAQS